MTRKTDIFAEKKKTKEMERLLADGWSAADSKSWKKAT